MCMTCEVSKVMLDEQVDCCVSVSMCSLSTSSSLNSHFTLCLQSPYVRTEQFNVTLPSFSCLVTDQDGKVLMESYVSKMKWTSVIGFVSFCSKKIMKALLTVNDRQINHWVLALLQSCFVVLSAAVLTNILHCDLLYNQWTVLCYTQSVQFICSNLSFINLARFNQLYCFYVTIHPGSVVTFIQIVFHIFTRQCDITSISDNEGQTVLISCC